LAVETMPTVGIRQYNPLNKSLRFSQKLGVYPRFEKKAFEVGAPP
jgi:hypothetical protein